MPIIARGASSRQRPPAARTSDSLAWFQSCSESSSTPSKSKITASTTALVLPRIPRRALGSLAVHRDRSIWRLEMAHLGGTASTEIDAPLQDVWAVVEDVLTAPEWQGGLDRMTALEHDAQGRPTLVETENDIKVRRIKTHVRFRYEGPTRLAWTQEKGDMKSVDGAWELEDLGGGRTRATYKLDADPGRVLGMVIRGPVESAVRAMLVNARPGELKARVEGT